MIVPEQANPTDPTTRLSTPHEQLPPVHILLVDDNPNNLKVLSEALQGQGWKALMATDGESAIAQAEYAQPDLILLDVMMPGMSGFETCHALKTNAITQDIPIIFMTALSEATDKVKGLNLGAVDYITKPFQQEEVIARLKLHLKISHLTRTLEQRVEERTAALTDLIQQLQHTQLQLIQSEKMSTLGQLVAGIGHEINNPIGFIGGNLSHIQNYMQDLFQILEAYQARLPNPDSNLVDLLEEVDLDYLIEDMPKLVESMQQGVTRLQDISLSLRTFARSDISTKTDFQVHDGIDSALILLKHRLKANENRPEIAVIKEYGSLPPIRCHPGQLNQVFMNILANAIDALEEVSEKQASETNQKHSSQILIRTACLDKNHIAIHIADNGKGMPEAVKEQIFDHLFTTKAVGKGTGLGLAISYQIIVEKHGGSIDVNSQAEQGTEFIITLPVQSNSNFEN